MIFHKQRHRHQPHRGVHGDCHRAALASIFELPLDAVPHFAEGSPPVAEFNRRIEDWLNERNLTSWTAPMQGELQRVLDALGNGSPSAYWLLSGRSKSGVDHTVIGRRGRIVHDPSPDNVGVIAPGAGGCFWVTFLLVREPQLCRSTETVHVQIVRRKSLWERLSSFWLQVAEDAL